MLNFNLRTRRYLPIVTFLAAAALQAGIAAAAAPRNDAQAQAGALLVGARSADSRAAPLSSGGLAIASTSGVGSRSSDRRANALDPQAQARQLILGSSPSGAGEVRRAPGVVGFHMAASRSGTGDPQQHARDLILGHGV